MPKQWMRSVLLIITYTVLLVLGLMRSDWIFGLLGQILSGWPPAVHRVCHRLYSEPALRLLLPAL